VQQILDKNKAAPARSRGREEYLLTTKLFCGYCHEMMTGYGGTGKSGKAYHYYACKKAKNHECIKRVVDKAAIEDKVVMACQMLLTDDTIRRIAEAIDEVCTSELDTSAVKRIRAAIKEADTAIENLWQALEKGQAAEMITERIDKRQAEKAALEAQLATEQQKQVVLSSKEVAHFLTMLRKGDINSVENRRSMINIFVRAIYLYDDKFTMVLSGSGRPIEIEDVLLGEIEDYFDSEVSGRAECSSMVADAPPLILTQ